jgi:hypothetical protein
MTGVSGRFDLVRDSGPKPKAELEPQPAHRRRRSLIASASIVITLLTPPAAFAQDVTAPALKAAYVYSFVKFTAWPAVVPSSDPFVMCVMGDAAVGEALEQLVAGRQFAGRQLITTPIAISRPISGCHVLYVSGAMVSEAAQVLAKLRDSPVLTISDGVGFTESGGMAQLFIERGRLRFTIKMENVERSGLKMSSKLLSLAQQ